MPWFLLVESTVSDFGDVPDLGWGPGYGCSAFHETKRPPKVARHCTKGERVSCGSAGVPPAAAAV